MKASSTVVAYAMGIGLVSTAVGQLEIVDTIPGTFIDISKTGTPLGLGDNEEVAIMTTIGNAVFPAGIVVIGNNGAIGFAPPDTDLSNINTPIPSMTAFGGGQSAMAFWDDEGSDDGDVWVLETTTMLIVQWLRDFVGSDDTGFFQIQIPGSPRGEVFGQFLYADIQQPFPNGGAIATIGYQDGGRGFNDFQWSFNQPNAVSNGTVLSIIVPAPAGASAFLIAGLAAGRRRRDPYRAF